MGRKERKRHGGVGNKNDVMEGEKEREGNVCERVGEREKEKATNIL